MENKQSPQPNNGKSGATHHLAHRTRYRLAQKHRDAKTFKNVHESIMRVPGVKKVELNERTGSVLVHHEENPEILPLLGTVLDEIGLDLFEGLFGAELIIVPGASLIADLVKSRLAGANNSVAQLTNNYLDLKTLLPLLFLGAGLYQAGQNRTWWKQVPAWALFYYAFDTYIKFNGTGANYNQIPVPGNGHQKLSS